MNETKLIFEKSIEGSMGISLPELDVDYIAYKDELSPHLIRREMPKLPQVSQIEAIRHYTELSRKNYGVETGFYPLGSCTMKYNPKINEEVCRFEGFTSIHPLQPESTVQGALELIYELNHYLCEITGMDNFSFQPAAGAQGEFAGLMIMKAYHVENNDLQRTTIIVPDSSHGTNPASAALAGFKVKQIPSDERGCVNLEALKEVVDKTTAGLMLTNPNTLGLFEEDILEIAEIVHEAGGLLYYDGANMNAIMDITRPGDMGFDVVHLNLHKTFSTPHGGGGPGSGPVGVKTALETFLPVPEIQYNDEKKVYALNSDKPQSIGAVKSFYGNFLVAVRAYAYILSMGAKGLKEVSETAVLNANYIMSHLKEYYDIPYDRTCMHEFVLSGESKKNDFGVSTFDIAKRLLDFKFHPPTVYFPLIVKEALMIEPTETEGKDMLDEFIKAMITIATEIENNADILHAAPCNTPVRRLDEAGAARNPVLRG